MNRLKLGRKQEPEILQHLKKSLFNKNFLLPETNSSLLIFNKQKD